MRVWQKDEWRWCKFMFADKPHVGIVIEGGQDKEPQNWNYRMVTIETSELGSIGVDWPDILALGPKVKPPKF